MNNQLAIHVAAELVVIGGVTFYFQRQLSSARAKIESLEQELAHQRHLLMKHENLINQLIMKHHHSMKVSPDGNSYGINPNVSDGSQKIGPFPTDYDQYAKPPVYPPSTTNPDSAKDSNRDEKKEDEKDEGEKKRDRNNLLGPGGLGGLGSMVGVLLGQASSAHIHTTMSGKSGGNNRPRITEVNEVNEENEDDEEEKRVVDDKELENELKELVAEEEEVEFITEDVFEKSGKNDGS